MLQMNRRTLTILVTAAVAVVFVGTMFGAFVAFVPQASENSSQGTAVDSTKTTPAPPPTPTPDPRAATSNGVSVTLTDIRKSTDPKGIELTLDLSNQTKSALDFAFFPAKDISLSDNLGSNYNFRWAEYAGEMKVEPGQKTRLVHAFFAGPDRDTVPDQLVVSLSGVPQVGKATWEIDWPATATRPGRISAAVPTPTPQPDKATNGAGSMITQNKVSITLTGAEFNSELGGVVVTMFILNNTGTELAFPFSPERSLAVTDNKGGKLNLKWAEYDGNLKVARGQQVRLVKAFFEGAVQDELITSLTISTGEIPEFGKASWQVPVKR